MERGIVQRRRWSESLEIVIITIGATAALATLASYLTSPPAKSGKRGSNPQFLLLSRLLWLLTVAGVGAICVRIAGRGATGLADWIAFAAIALGAIGGMLWFYPRGQMKDGDWSNKAAHWLHKKRWAWVVPIGLGTAGAVWLFRALLGA